MLWGAGSHALAFDPNAALQQQREQQEAEREATKVIKDQSIYNQYRNKSEVQISDDGTVTIGRLQWMRCSLGQRWNGKTCLDKPTSHKLDDAIALPRLMNTQGGFANYADWRLPTIGELVMLRQCSTGRSSGTVTLPNGQKRSGSVAMAQINRLSTVAPSRIPQATSIIFGHKRKTLNFQASLGV